MVEKVEKVEMVERARCWQGRGTNTTDSILGLKDTNYKLATAINPH
jgi:hypothetical protein